MKKTKIIKVISIISLIFAGITFASSFNVSNNRTDKVEAEGTKIIYLEPGVWNDGGAKLWLHPHSGSVGDVFFSSVTDGICTAEVDASCNSFTFVRGSNNGGLGDWTNVWEQTDWTFNNGKNYLKVKNWKTYDDHVYNPNGTNKALLRGDYGPEPAWSENTAISMVSNGDNEIMATIPLKAGDEFRIYTDNKLDPYWNTDFTNIKTSSPAKVSKNGDNFHANDDLEEGAYVIYYTYSGYDTGVYIAKSVDDEKSLSCYVMQSDVEGQCITKFYSARTRYINMSDTSKEAFKTTDGGVRYEAWAKALGENPWENSKASTAPFVRLAEMTSDTTTWIIVAISLAGLSAIGIFFIYRRRKEN